VQETQSELEGPEQVEQEESQLRHYGLGRETEYCPGLHVPVQEVVDAWK